ncbi:glycoside hydrolase superfamily [Trametes meyenii]|nr:glycoside hydrolase superfamily [Trametes meyenii]
MLWGALGLPATSDGSQFNSKSGLNLAAKRAGKLYLGTATNSDQWNDTTYFNILKDDAEFRQVTAANVMKWFATELEEAGPCVYRFAPLFQPDTWNVINEAFNDDGTYRSDIFFDTLNTTYIPLALYAARAKPTALKNLIKQLQADGVPIDGVGLQSHFEVGGVPPTLQQTTEEFVALELEVAITELDIRFAAPPPDAAGVAQQKDYETVIGACNAVGLHGQAVLVDTWHFRWSGDACPWDENFVKKPAYTGIIEAFNTRNY